jgi:hypothetical protein
MVILICHVYTHVRIPRVIVTRCIPSILFFKKRVMLYISRGMPDYFYVSCMQLVICQILVHTCIGWYIYFKLIEEHNLYSTTRAFYEIMSTARVIMINFHVFKTRQVKTTPRVQTKVHVFLIACDTCVFRVCIHCIMGVIPSMCRIRRDVYMTT